MSVPRAEIKDAKESIHSTCMSAQLAEDVNTWRTSGLMASRGSWDSSLHVSRMSPLASKAASAALSTPAFAASMLCAQTHSSNSGMGRDGGGFVATAVEGVVAAVGQVVAS